MDDRTFVHKLQNLEKKWQLEMEVRFHRCDTQAQDQWERSSLVLDPEDNKTWTLQDLLHVRQSFCLCVKYKFRLKVRNTWGNKSVTAFQKPDAGNLLAGPSLTNRIPDFTFQCCQLQESQSQTQSEHHRTYFVTAAGIGPNDNTTSKMNAHPCPYYEGGILRRKNSCPMNLLFWKARYK